nr:hypothetical protein [Escherichia coli]
MTRSEYDEAGRLKARRMRRGGGRSTLHMASGR